jgi:ubiquinone/menaquinone biosynthesis C-methylase UbiE
MPTNSNRDADTSGLKNAIKDKYAGAAQEVMTGCCRPGTTTHLANDPITSNLYDEMQRSGLPLKAVLASLGCGNPTALADLRCGETVLDLGSGGGIDVLLSAQRVSPGGKAYGLDMTDEMLALARANQAHAGIDNVEFLKGEIEHIPLPDNSIDVVISNCVINLSADKDRVFREAYRVLRPGGRLAVSDVVTVGSVRPDIRNNMLSWMGCVAGALERDEYHAKLIEAGFINVELTTTRVYRTGDARQFLAEQGVKLDTSGDELDGKFISAFVRAVKPA